MDGIVGGEADARAYGRPAAEIRSRSALQQRLVDLEHLNAAGLRQEWRRLFRSDPPPLSRDLVLRAQAYRLQEREQGGLSKETLRAIAG